MKPLLILTALLVLLPHESTTTTTTTTTTVVTESPTPLPLTISTVQPAGCCFVITGEMFDSNGTKHASLEVMVHIVGDRDSDGDCDLADIAMWMNGPRTTWVWAVTPSPGLSVVRYRLTPLGMWALLAKQMTGPMGTDHG